MRGRDHLLTMTLVEILVVMLFLAAADADIAQTQWQDDYEESQERNKALDDELDALRKEHKKLLDDLVTCRAQLNRSQGLALDDRDKFDQYVNELAACRTKVAALDDQTKRLASEKQALEGRLKKAQRREDALRQQIQNLETQLSIAQSLLERTRKQLDELIPDRDRVVAERDMLRAKLKTLQEAQDGLSEKLRKSNAGRGGSDLPNCLGVASHIYLFDITDRPGPRMSLKPAWKDPKLDWVMDVPGVSELLAEGRARNGMALSRFKSLSRRVLEWGDAQEQRCRFRVNITKHLVTDLDEYRRVQWVIGQHYYAKWF